MVNGCHTSAALTSQPLHVPSVAPGTYRQPSEPTTTLRVPTSLRPACHLCATWQSERANQFRQTRLSQRPGGYRTQVSWGEEPHNGAATRPHSWGIITHTCHSFRKSYQCVCVCVCSRCGVVASRGLSKVRWRGSVRPRQHGDGQVPGASGNDGRQRAHAEPCCSWHVPGPVENVHSHWALLRRWGEKIIHLINIFHLNFLGFLCMLKCEVSLNWINVVLCNLILSQWSMDCTWVLFQCLHCTPKPFTKAPYALIYTQSHTIGFFSLETEAIVIILSLLTPTDFYQKHDDSPHILIIECFLLLA